MKFHEHKSQIIKKNIIIEYKKIISLVFKNTYIKYSGTG